MQQITDITTLLQQLGAFAYAADTPPELSHKLQTAPGSSVDRIFSGIEMLYAFRDQIGLTGLNTLGQLTGYAIMSGWQVPGQPDRIDGIYKGVMRDLGEPGTWPLVAEDPDPQVLYREDGLSWKDGVEPDLEALRASKWRIVKDKRAALENGVAPTPVGQVQCDEGSKQKINGMVTMAVIALQNSQPFSEEFTLYDNTVVTLDAVSAIGMGVCTGKFISAIYANARVLRDAINGAATVDDLNAVDLDAGWPDPAVVIS